MTHSPNDSNDGYLEVHPSYQSHGYLELLPDEVTSRNQSAPTADAENEYTYIGDLEARPRLPAPGASVEVAVPVGYSVPEEDYDDTEAEATEGYDDTEAETRGEYHDTEAEATEGYDTEAETRGEYDDTEAPDQTPYSNDRVIRPRHHRPR